MGAICDHYALFKLSHNNNYGRNVFVVFDGYKKNSIKSAERNRRAPKNKCTEFSENASLKII